MKKLIPLLLAGLALALSTGCVSQMGSEYAKFIQAVPGVKATGVSAVTLSPLYSHSESASGISTDPTTGIMTVVDGTAQITIPLWGFSKTIKITGLQVQASAEQLAAARTPAAVTSATEPPK